MSWNTNMWSFNSGDSQISEHYPERETPMHWQTQQGTMESVNYRQPQQTHSYQRWKNENGLGTPAQPRESGNRSQSIQQFNHSTQRRDGMVTQSHHEPNYRHNSQETNTEARSRDFNFNQHAVQRGGRRNIPRNPWQETCNQGGGGSAPEFTQGIQSGHLPNTSRSAQSMAFPVRSRNENRQQCNKNMWNYSVTDTQEGMNSYDSGAQRKPMTQNMESYAGNPRVKMMSSSKNDCPLPQSANKWGEGTATSQKSAVASGNGANAKRLKTSMRVLTCTAEGIHHWINSLAERVPLIFELFGTVTAVEYSEDKVDLNIKGKTLDICCTFYCMDQESPNIMEGECIRAIGRMDLNNNVFQCLSLRSATKDEKAVALKLVQSCDRVMQRFHMFQNEM